MNDQNKDKKLKIIAGALIIILLVFLAYYVSLKISSNDIQEVNTESSDGFFNFFSNKSNEDDQEINEGQWYVGYMNRRSQTMSYSQLFVTEKECLAYELKVEDTASLEVVIPCFEVPVGNEGPRGVDVFTSDIFLQQEDENTEINLDVKRDTTPPVITLKGDNPARVSIGDTYVDFGATAVDNKDGDLTGKISVNGLPVVTFRKSKSTITYRVSDSAGNPGYATREVHVVTENVVQPTQGVVKDKTSTTPIAKKPNWIGNTDPIIVLRGFNPTQLSIGAEYNDSGAAAYDLEDGEITSKIQITGLPIDTKITGDYYVTYQVTDRDGSTVETTRIVEVSEFNIDMTSDVSYLKSCFGNMARGLCKIVDVNKNGAVGSGDEDAFIEILLPFEVSGDPSINLSLEGTITSCFFKINGQCALNDYRNLEVTRAQLDSIRQDSLAASVANGYEYGVDLGKLKINLGSTPVDKIVYEIFKQYDLNKDGVADLSGWIGGDGLNNKDRDIFNLCVTKPAVGNCVDADMNNDGSVQDWDLIMFNAMQSDYLPEVFTIEEVEESMFDRSLYSDAVIVSYCVDKKISQGVCELVDFNRDGKVDGLDQILFDETVPQYDFNKDGIIDGIQISF